MKEEEDMPKSRIAVPQLQEKVLKGQKKFVRYAEGAELY